MRLIYKKANCVGCPCIMYILSNCINSPTSCLCALHVSAWECSLYYFQEGLHQCSEYSLCAHVYVVWWMFLHKVYLSSNY